MSDLTAKTKDEADLRAKLTAREREVARLRKERDELRRRIWRQAMSEIDIYAAKDGRLQYVHDDEAAELFRSGESETRRASHVEPDGRGGWTADMRPCGGQVLGPFARRDEALAWERRWLEARMKFGDLAVGL